MHVGIEPSKTIDGNDTTIHSHHTYILYYALCLLVVCIGGLWKAVGRVVLGVECMCGALSDTPRCGSLIIHAQTETEV